MDGFVTRSDDQSSSWRDCEMSAEGRPEGPPRSSSLPWHATGLDSGLSTTHYFVIQGVLNANGLIIFLLFFRFLLRESKRCRFREVV